MTQGLLPGMDGEHGVRDPLGRRYTPDRLAASVISRIAVYRTEVPEGTWFVDGHVGGGAFVRMAKKRWPNIRLLGVDIDPLAPGFEHCDEKIVGDWSVVAKEIVPRFRWPIIGGNPPFDDPKGKPPDPTRAQRHLRATLDAYERRPVEMGWILPLAYLGTKAWGELLGRFPPDHVDPITGRPWGENVRETAAYFFGDTRDRATLSANERAHLAWNTKLGRPIDDWQEAA